MTKHLVIKNFWNKFWKDDHGRVVIWQAPNSPLWSWIAFKIASMLFSGTTASIFSWASSVALLIWAGLELIQGVNYFRRTVGFIIIVFTLKSIVEQFIT